MGTCQSRQPSPVIIDENQRKPTVEIQRKSTVETVEDPNKCSTIVETHSTWISTLDSPALSLESAHRDYRVESGPTIAKEPPIHEIISNVSIPTMESVEDESRPKHVRKKSGMVKEYLEEASNRIMVHIETPFGLPIEEVYDGVHDGKVLGEGIAGKVRLVTHRETAIQRAVKRLDLSLVTNDEDLDRLLDEIKIMCCLDHPNVVCLEEVFEGEDELFLTQELCAGGDLFDRLDEQPDCCYTEARCARLITQIIRSVSYLHSKNIVHRDLKLENFLFQDASDECELKMIDFGLSKHFVRGEVQREAVGTPYTVAPEVLAGEYDEKCDVWGIGVLAYLLLSGEAPFGGACEGEDLQMVRSNILSGNVPFGEPCWDAISDEARDFVRSLLVLEPEMRPGAGELQNHPWLRSMKRNSYSGGNVCRSFLSKRVLNGLVSFKELSSTRKFLSELVSYTLQPDQIRGLQREFEKMDLDGTGEISLDCFREALIANSYQHSLTEDEIEAIFNGLKVRNTDMSASIRWHEFISACLSQCRIDDRNIRLAFDRLDNERKGYITLIDLKNAMDFYGSNSRYDLQSTWINNVLDYKSNKEHMNFEDFYKLLKLERDAECTHPIQLGKQQQPLPRTRTRQGTFERSYTKPMKLAPSVGSNEIRCRHHSMGPVLNLDLQNTLLDDREPIVVSNMKASRNIHDFVLEASKRAEDERKKKESCVPSRRASITGKKGLFMRRNSQELNTQYLRCCSGG